MNRGKWGDRAALDISTQTTLAIRDYTGLSEQQLKVIEKMKPLDRPKPSQPVAILPAEVIDAQPPPRRRRLQVDL